jgi:hypothetical protein
LLYLPVLSSLPNAPQKQASPPDRLIAVLSVTAVCCMQGASSLVGVKSLEEAVKAHAEGADVLLLRREMLEEAERGQGVKSLIERMKDATSGDD